MLIATPPQRLLIVKPSSFGDIIHTLPALDALRRHWPQAQIDWLVKEEWAELLRGQPALRELVLLPKTFDQWRSLAQSFPARRYDVVIDFQGLLRSGVASWLTRAPARIGFAGAREASRWFYTARIACAPAVLHAVDRNLDLLRQIGVPAAPARFPFAVPAESAGWAQALCARERIGAADKIVVLHPAARWRTKRWPAERFAQVADRLAANPGVRIIFVAGGEQAGQVDEVMRQVSGKVVNLAGRCTLLELAALLKRAHLAISNDSGPMHLAAALGTPVIGLFGPTDPRRVGPYGAGHSALKKQFACPGCTRRACVRDQSCLKAIAVDDVLSAAAALLRGRPAAPEWAGAAL